ncbi:hypothetical protein NPIL_72491 [Nephila pilipes]|uniref:Uncharacterized protein n=1 Tax=Nephila pilipes TaxID=299642 RepID=A0A8X6Q4I4_NEPPI|nr:hypothetical protein NPIL_72491 [Nephila pilipes]
MGQNFLFVELSSTRASRFSAKDSGEVNYTFSSVAKEHTGAACRVKHKDRISGFGKSNPSPIESWFIVQAGQRVLESPCKRNQCLKLFQRTPSGGMDPRFLGQTNFLTNGLDETDSRKIVFSRGSRKNSNLETDISLTITSFIMSQIISLQT